VRFELELFRRYHAVLTLRPGPVVPVRSARDYVFDTLAASFAHVPAILAADKRAAAGRTEYDDSYFQVFFDEVRPVLELRMSDSATAIASIITAAWVQAGRPVLPVTQPAPPNRKVLTK
jgi:hypothetical protein